MLPFTIDIKLLLGSLTATTVFLYNQVFNIVIHVVLLCMYANIKGYKTRGIHYIDHIHKMYLGDLV